MAAGHLPFEEIACYRALSFMSYKAALSRSCCLRGRFGQPGFDDENEPFRSFVNTLCAFSSISVATTFCLCACEREMRNTIKGNNAMVSVNFVDGRNENVCTVGIIMK